MWCNSSMTFWILLTIIAVSVLAFLLSRKMRENVVGICASALDQTVRKNANKEKALALIQERGEASNSDIREALGVSERTAVRYMDELEREGKAEQVGKTGRSVQYRLKR